jgi:hypothetical protein
MALPTLQPYYLTKRTNAESLIVKRRAHEADVKEQWGKHSKYFEQQGVRSTKQQAWSSHQSFYDSMNAFSTRMEKEDKERRLRDRRLKLSKLLECERQLYDMQLKELAGTPQKRLPEMKQR